MRPAARYGALLLVFCFAACSDDTHVAAPPTRGQSPEAVRETAHEASAETAVKAYESLGVVTLEDVAQSVFMKDSADVATALVGDSTTHAKLIARITKRAAYIANIKEGLEAEAIVKENMDLIRATEVVALHRVTVETYDGSGQSVHPDVIRFEKPWAGYKCWMVLTPYASSVLENPSLYANQDCDQWEPAVGVSAPLVAPPSYGFNSDPEILFDKKRGCLQIVYREVVYDNAIKETESCNGTLWSTPRMLFSLPNHEAISPSITEGPDGLKHVLYVNTGSDGCGAKSVKLTTRILSDDLLPSDASPAQVLNLVQPGYIIWHAKWRYVSEKQEYWVLYAAYPSSANGCLQNDLFLARSRDLKKWRTYQIPILSRFETRFRLASLYRATFLYDAASDRLSVLTSVYEGDVGWQEFGVTYDYSELVKVLDLRETLSKSALLSMRAVSSLNGRRVAGPSIFNGIWP